MILLPEHANNRALKDALPRRLDGELTAWIVGRRWYPKDAPRPDVLDTWVPAPSSRTWILRAGGTRLHVPLTVVKEPPRADLELLWRDGLCVIESELVPEYASRLLEGGLRGYEYHQLSEVPEGEVEISVISEGSTNRLVSASAQGDRVVMKSYRVMAGVGVEPKFLRGLTEAGFELAPRLRMTLARRGTPAVVVVDFLAGECDGGKPFFDALTRLLRGGSSAKGPVDELVETIASLHVTVCSIDDPWFYPEPTTELDVRCWAERILGRYDWLKQALPNALEGESLNLAASLLRRAEESVREAVRAMRGFEGRAKLRIHQDLHTGQTIYDGRRFYVVDFEGEPGRTEQERLLKEPALRDLACVLRGFSYLTFAAVAHEAGSVKDCAAAIMAGEYPEARDWLSGVSAELISKYLDLTSGKSKELHGVPGDELSEFAGLAIEAWKVEKALYEALYEVRFRPDWTLIPLLGLAGYL